MACLFLSVSITSISIFTVLHTMTNLPSQTTRHTKKEGDVVAGGNCQEKENRTQLKYDSLLKTPDREIKIVT